MFVFDDKNNYRINLKRSIQMALISKIKRFFSPKIVKPKNKYIHVGCGFHKFNNFDNLDFIFLKVGDDKFRMQNSKSK